VIPLESISRCFEGIVPATLSTCSAAGIPNISSISHVQYVDARHVAVSRQFFNKTTRNILENPQASVTVWDPVTFEIYILTLRYARSETSGPTFDRMATRIEAIASHTGMAGIFRLLAADVFEVLSIYHLTEHLNPPEKSDPPDPDLPDMSPEPAAVPPEQREELWVLQRISSRMNQAPDLEALLEEVLGSLNEDFGFTHAKVLLVDETGRRLFTVASRGYDESGVGSEVVFGEGLIGTVARDRRILRVNQMESGLRYGRAMRAAVASASTGTPLRPEIPLPGLVDAQSHLVLPLLVRGRLVGVLALESRNPAAFATWHEAFMGIVADQVAAGIERLAVSDAEDPVAAGRRARGAKEDQAKEDQPPPVVAPRRRAFVFYQNDDCVFVDGEYLIRNVPGRILWKLLKAHQEMGRSEFTNRELRLDPGLGLPSLRDNLESRLILLRQRLAQKCPDVRLPSRGRGRFAVEIDSELALTERASA
jgi:hypothetical protein